MNIDEKWWGRYSCPPDKPKEACGIVGVFSRTSREAARLCFFGLFTLQHRGQESAGIAVSDGTELTCEKGMGLVTHVFSEERIAPLRGRIAVGHTRYSTTGTSALCNAQPIEGNFRGIPFVLGHNGNLVNSRQLREELANNGAAFHSSVDSELIVRLIEEAPGEDFLQAVEHALARLQGAYSLVIMSPDRLVGVRDPRGFRPLCLGRLDGEGYVLASETCALHTLGATLIREVDPGEMIVVTDEGYEERRFSQHRHDSMCMFEYIYLARPDSHIFGKSVYEVRRRMGNLLAQEHPVQADLVVPIPDTGVPAAIGFAEVSGIPCDECLIKNRYIFRTFIEPDQRLRDQGVKMKLSPIRERLTGKRVVAVDDSIVRGTTTRALVQLLRDAGAIEIHLRITAPPIQWPCYYGIDMATREELIAAHLTVDQIREVLGASSLGYLSIKNVVRAVGLPKDKFCLACFDGRYPIKPPSKAKLDKFVLETAIAGERPSIGEG